MQAASIAAIAASPSRDFQLMPPLDGSFVFVSIRNSFPRQQQPLLQRASVAELNGRVFLASKMLSTRAKC